MAERVGFEPTCRLRDNTLSRRAPSAARSPLRIVQAAAICRCLLLSAVQWRRGRDSNPRMGNEPITRFRVVRDQPDSATSPHPSLSAPICRCLLLSAVEMAPPARFERATRNLGGCCSIQAELRGHRQVLQWIVVSKQWPVPPTVLICRCLLFSASICRILARSARFERATPGSAGQCSIP